VPKDSADSRLLDRWQLQDMFVATLDPADVWRCRLWTEFKRQTASAAEPDNLQGAKVRETRCQRQTFTQHAHHHYTLAPIFKHTILFLIVMELFYVNGLFLGSDRSLYLDFLLTLET
jgi:hypothetical protein